MTDTPTAEQIAKHYSAAMDSVALITALTTRITALENNNATQ
jgi:hypothetical protein